MTSRASDRLTIDWYEAGALSIVVQGAVSKDNLIEIANHCMHWRQLFPKAQLILAISVTDVLTGDVTGSVLASIDLVRSHADNGYLRAALNVILKVCDRITLSESVLPLPPIKSDSPKLNNINFQISAARQGLELATGEFVLRVRNDLIFLDQSFIRQYEDAERVQRGEATVFARRVMISWLFTLNPLTNERLPFHFSDWFHFGLTTDVRRLWDIPFVTLQDAVHYRAHNHAPGSNAAERLFNIRLAVEQHVIYHCFRNSFPELVLEYHNDQRSIDLSFDVLIDNFTLCDMQSAKCVFDKYAGEFTDYSKRLHCLTREDWFAVAEARDVDYRLTLAPKIAAFCDSRLAMLKEGLPRVYEAARLTIADGRLVNGEAVATSSEGVLFYGPFTALTEGLYSATLKATTLMGRGSVVLHATMNSGRDLLAERILSVESGCAPELEIDFDIVLPSATEVEIVCRYEGLRAFAVASLTFAKREQEVRSAPKYQQELPRTFNADRLLTRHGRHVDGQLVAAGQDGVLFYGPYAFFSPGSYIAKVNVTSLLGRGSVNLKVTRNFGDDVLAERVCSIGSETMADLSIDFDVPGREASKLEVVCVVDGLDHISISGIEILARVARPIPVTEPSHPPQPKSLLNRLWH